MLNLVMIGKGGTVQVPQKYGNDVVRLTRAPVFRSQGLGEIPMSHPQWGAKYRWGMLKSAIFDQYLTISQKWCKIGT